MYLIDTNVVSEARKGRRAHLGVQVFFARVVQEREPCYLSVVTIGELRRGVELIRHRGDLDQAAVLERWLGDLLAEYGDCVLDYDAEAAQVWGRLRVPRPENALDKQLAATALVYDLTVVTRNHRDFAGIGVRTVNPFAEPV
ncbi:MAG: PIN domain-containing protein [Deferrisomatales bacterium]